MEVSLAEVRHASRPDSHDSTKEAWRQLVEGSEPHKEAHQEVNLQPQDVVSVARGWQRRSMSGD